MVEAKQTSIAMIMLRAARAAFIADAKLSPTVRMLKRMRIEYTFSDAADTEKTYFLEVEE